MTRVDLLLAASAKQIHVSHSHQQQQAIDKISNKNRDWFIRLPTKAITWSNITVRQGTVVAFSLADETSLTVSCLPSDQ